MWNGFEEGGEMPICLAGELAKRTTYRPDLRGDRADEDNQLDEAELKDVTEIDQSEPTKWLQSVEAVPVKD